MIKVLYFASLRERLGQSSEDLDLPEGVTHLGGLSAHLAARGGAWEQALGGSETLMMAVNQEAARADSQVKDGDELAFFPPVTGG